MLGRHVSVAKFVLEVAGNLENDTFLLGMMKVSMFFLEILVFINLLQNRSLLRHCSLSAQVACEFDPSSL